ncbi:unnamed protein product [Coffea canephora]|uniref:Pentacotripeptide-repeat region of PRORP domain-containing protein n=1 Tax=Coffea canephora TaxID=49390 RepID=A0A068UTU0_COFCA|nr:unnamed protein product [Coffea canephora]
MNAASFLNHVLRNATSTTGHRKPPQSTNAKNLTAAILNHLRLGRTSKAVSILFSSPVPFDFSLYARLFQLCASSRAIVEARKVESHLVTFTPNPPTFLLNRAIETYGKCGCLADARELFDEMPRRDGGSWNAMITAYSHNGCPGKALDLFSHMHKSGIYASEVTFSSVFGSCASVLALWLAKQVHGLIVKYGFCGNVILESSLVHVYGKCGMMSESRRMFDEIENPNSVSWNVIVRRYLEMKEGEQAVLMFSKMVRVKVRPLNHTVSNALVACSSIHGLKEGVQIHGYAIKINLEVDEIVSSSLIDMYAKCGDMESASLMFKLPSSKNLIAWTAMVSGYGMSGKIREARELFDEMPERSMVSWNAMLSGYTHFSKWNEALDFLSLMLKETRAVDHVTLGLVLKVSSAIMDIELGKQVHGYVYRHGFYCNLLVSNALLDMYGKCGNLRCARVWFYAISHLRDEVSWNNLLTSYARHELSEETMTMFWKMLGETMPSNFTFATLLAACANIFALEPGKQIHGFMIRNDYEMDIVITGALVDMYSKCRCIDYALGVFKVADLRDVILWNSTILGCFHNRRYDKVLELFKLMENEGIKPDHVTIQGILLACIAEGCVELGRQYFDSMTDKYCIIPRLEHYQSMIELYGRSGWMDELKDFIKKMPFEPTEAMLIRFFDLCQEQKHFKLGEWAADQLNRLNPTIPFQIGTADST